MPLPLVAIIVLTIVTVAAQIAVPTVGDQCAVPDTLPSLFLPDVPFDSYPADHRPVRARDGPGRAARIVDDGEAGR